MDNTSNLEEMAQALQAPQNQFKYSLDQTKIVNSALGHMLVKQLYLILNLLTLKVNLKV